MNNAGAIEVLMPVVQPSALWQESGRWEQYGPELLRIADRGEMCIRDRRLGIHFSSCDVKNPYRRVPTQIV